MSDDDGQMNFDNIRDIPHARTDDPSTSQLSAAQTEAEEGKTSVLRPGSAKHVALSLIAEQSRTANEVERVSGKRGIWKRVSDLKNARLVEASYTYRDPLTRRLGTVWQTTARGRWALGLLDAGQEVQL